MPIQYKKNLAVFDDVVSVEDAEDLLQWCQKNPKAKADFSGCIHLHAANLQVLMAAGVTVTNWPHDPSLATWLHAAMDA
ncbi:hypothetical protein [Actimicrobium sp. CCI2.3]|uniref:hypothetical protein n=1 Tax=Actimicrobium sp. CCI2.3 TaxID=3048616 RepID=UPI002AB41299|nr:hypothetical protein [Actimicrobium sp. CCI2.3]MDY7574815.1 hypothetical protein [Actimicrobium sp. CCI2.3]MEB0020224.1 hypothetical protein [Actimicrobium sp. CCI2.3]